MLSPFGPSRQRHLIAKGGVGTNGCIEACLVLFVFILHLLPVRAGCMYAEEATNKPAADRSDVDSNTNDDAAKSNPGRRNSGSTSGDASPAASTAGVSAAARPKRRRHGDRPPLVATRCLPARDSRIAAALQNQFVVECERFGWHISPSGGGNKKGSSTKADNAAPSTEGRAAARRSARQSGTTVSSPKRQAAASLPKKRSMSVPEEPALSVRASAKGGSSPRDKPKRSAHDITVGGKNASMEEKASTVREPPPTESGRPRRHAADRAAAAIVAAAAPSNGGFLVLDIPPQGAIAIPPKKRAKRQESGGTGGSESSDCPADEVAKTAGGISNKGTAEARGSDAAKNLQEATTSTDPDSNADRTEEEKRERDKRKTREAVAETDAESEPAAEALPVAESSAKDEPQGVTGGEADGTNGEVEVRVELGTP